MHSVSEGRTFDSPSCPALTNQKDTRELPTVQPYNPSMAAEWNAFVARSKNGTFLFDRGYMEYHSDRFTDCSFVARDDVGRLLGLFPATLHGDEIISHGGLTFGGWITDTRMRVRMMFDLMNGLVEQAPAKTIAYKAIPSIYHRQPADEDLYALTRIGARLIRRDVSAVIWQRDPIGYASLRKRKIKAANEAGLVVRETADYSSYHAILSDVLVRHDAKPVHSIEELELLHGRFSDNIRLFAAYQGDEMLGGTIVFDNGFVAHTQYLANSAEGRDLGALDLVLSQLVSEIFRDREYFSFGISTESGGTVLNEGLIAQKEGFGARAVVHDFYEIDTSMRITPP